MVCRKHWMPIKYSGGNLTYQDYASDIREILAYKQTQHKGIMSGLNVQFVMADGTIQIK
ncbi:MULTISPECIES: hypothetical protein [unclassified Roseburia]|jgi:hypothetical protein|uniref:hypothetical protein n=1 Tax=unclassified Roseburia TaxID=2637578 RepID=UPI001FA8C799|nr:MULTISPECIES: hypothetical protein [unclassified Roseburia]